MSLQVPHTNPNPQPTFYQALEREPGTLPVVTARSVAPGPGERAPGRLPQAGDVAAGRRLPGALRARAPSNPNSWTCMRYRYRWV